MLYESAIKTQMKRMVSIVWCGTWILDEINDIIDNLGF